MQKSSRALGEGEGKQLKKTFLEVKVKDVGDVSAFHISWILIDI